MQPIKSEPKPKASRNIIVAIVLLLFSLSWWRLTILIYQKASEQLATTYLTAGFAASASYYVSVVVFSIIGSALDKRTKNLSFLYYWMAAGAIISLFPILSPISSVWHLVFVSSLLGAAFGIGMPSCLAFLAETVRLEIRGSTSGAAFLTSSMAIVLLTIAVGGLELTSIALLCCAWRFLGLVMFMLLTYGGRTEIETKRQPTFSSIYRSGSFLLYFIPWLAFCLLDWLEGPIINNLVGETFARSSSVAGLAITSFCAALGGILADRIGRKIIVLYGFVSIGIAYAVLSIAPGNIISWSFFTIIESIAWGFFYPIFLLTLWGDLGQAYRKERYYAIGNMPFFIAGIMELVTSPYVSLIRPEAAFSLAAFFLFLAVLPLLYAHETLPEKKIKDREVKQYIDKAKKIKEKYA